MSNTRVCHRPVVFSPVLLGWKVPGSSPDKVNNFYFTLWAALGLDLHSAPYTNGTRSKKKMFWREKLRPARKADNLTAIFEPNV
jgi:hypothetical protein